MVILDPTFWNESRWYFLVWSFRDIYITVQSTQFSLNCGKNDQNRFAGLVIITIWSCSHHILRNQQTSGCMFRTPFNDIHKHSLCMRSMIFLMQKRLGNLILLKPQNLFLKKKKKKKRKLPSKISHSEKVPSYSSDSFPKAGSHTGLNHWYKKQKEKKKDL